MPRILLHILFGLAVLLLGNVVEAAPSKRASETLANLEKTLLSKNSRFKVGYSPVLEQARTELARTFVPANISEIAGSMWKSKKEPSVGSSAPQVKCEPTASTFSWRDHNLVTPVRSQGGCGDCWSFSATAVHEAVLLLFAKSNVDLSEQHLLDCAMDSSGEDAGSCNGGWYGDAFEYVVTHGTTTEVDQAYIGQENTCKSVKDPISKILQWGYVTEDASPPSLTQMKEALCAFGPLSSTVYITDAFMAYAGGVFDEVPDTSGPIDVNHAVTIVGWDDSKQAYLVKNSWDTSWGEEGYIWVGYGAANLGYGTAWAAVSEEVVAAATANQSDAEESSSCAAATKHSSANAWVMFPVLLMLLRVRRNQRAL